MSEPDDGSVWSEADSESFIDLGRYYVPGREAQIATICGVIPEPPAGAHLVDLCCGEGLLSGALLDRFPGAAVHGYDGSPAMLARARDALAAHGERFTTRTFDLAAADWRRFPWPVHAVVSSLAIHHLDGPGKRRLFGDLAGTLSPGGALVIADLVEPTTAEGRAVAARAWDEAVRRRALDIDGTLAAYERFRADDWNYYADPDPDPIDQPSALRDQLEWLAAAGLADCDVHWMLAGHAVFSGRKPAP